MRRSFASWPGAKVLAQLYQGIPWHRCRGVRSFGSAIPGLLWDLEVRRSRLEGIGCTRAAKLTAAMWPYLPILRAFVLSQRRPATPAQRERLIQRIEAAVRSVNW